MLAGSFTAFQQVYASCHCADRTDKYSQLGAANSCSKILKLQMVRYKSMSNVLALDTVPLLHNYTSKYDARQKP